MSARSKTTVYERGSALLFSLGKRQKFFARDFAVLSGVNSHFRHLRPLVRSFVGYVDIELHNECIAGNKWPSHLRAVHFHVLLPPLGFSAYLVDAAHFRRHTFHCVRLHAYDVFRVEIVDCLHPIAFAAIFHQLCCDFFCTHSSSLFLIENCSTDISTVAASLSAAPKPRRRVPTRILCHFAGGRPATTIPLTTSYGSDDQKRFRTAGNRIRQRSVR